jgi:hypothetical protein
MDRTIRYLLCVGLTTAWILFMVVAAGNARAGERPGEEIPEGWQFFPRIGIGLEYGGYIAQQDHYASMLRRRLEMDVLQYRRHIFYMEFDEQIFFGTPFDKWDFNLMKFNLTLGGYRYDFGNYYLGTYVYHQCNNPFYTEKYHGLTDRERANLYYVGLEFLTKNMRLGMKDRGINFNSDRTFEFLGHWAGTAKANYIFFYQNSVLNALLQAKIRYDILRYYSMVPYVEVSGDLLIARITRLAPAVEVGTRFHFSHFDITPFFKWTRAQEFLTDTPSYKHALLAAKNSLFGGARIETLLDEATFGLGGEGAGLTLLPEIHGNMGYGLYSKNQDFKTHGKIEVDLEALRRDPWTIFLYTNVDLDTREQDLKPDKVTYWLQYGLTYARGHYFAEGFVLNQQRLDANIFRKTQERANLAGLRLGTKGMKPGHYNDGINFAGPTFQWLNLLNGQVSGGHYFQNRDWQYLWNVNLQARWDVLRWHFVIPYLQGEINWQAGGGPTGDTLDYAVEPGLRFHGVLDLALYYRFQHWNNALYFRAPSKGESLVGIRALF